MDEIKNLKDRVDLLESIINALVFTDKLAFTKLVQILDGKNIQLGTTTGSKIGTATAQKLGFWGVTPVIQPASGDQAVVSGTADSTYSGNEVTLINDIATLVNQLRSDLIDAGVIKGSA